MPGIDGLWKWVNLADATPRTAPYVAVLSPPSSSRSLPYASGIKSRQYDGPCLKSRSQTETSTSSKRQTTPAFGPAVPPQPVYQRQLGCGLRAGGRHSRCDGARVAALLRAALGVGRNRVAGSVIRNGEWEARDGWGLAPRFLVVLGRDEDATLV